MSYRPCSCPEQRHHKIEMLSELSPQLWVFYAALLTSLLRSPDFSLVHKQSKRPRNACSEYLVLIEPLCFRSLPRPASSPVEFLHGVAVPAALVGDVMQILEFLATFAEAIDMPHMSESKLLHELLEVDKLPRGDRCTLGQVRPSRFSLLALTPICVQT